MATDYDQPRRSDADEPEDSLEELKARRAEAQSSSVDVDEADLNEAIELPGARPVRRGADRARAAEAERRVHLQQLLPGAPPQPARLRQGRPDDLQGVRLARER
jgi:hypothetical protein